MKNIGEKSSQKINYVLRKLEESYNIKGLYISGEEIAQELGVSRAAVSKYIKSLTDLGYDIEAVSNRGYRFRDSNDRLSKGVIKDNLEFDNIEIEVFETIDSTNKYGKELLNGGFKGRKLIVANEQSAGRGRLGRTFYSPGDTGIYMSLIDTLDVDKNETLSVTIRAAVALRESIKNIIGRDCKIKWVNDIYIGDKKVAGILSEGVTNLESNKVEGIVVGIGVNYRTSDFPTELKDIASSLNGKAGNNRNLLIAEITNSYFKTLSLSEGEILERYKKELLYIGEDVVVYYPTGESEEALVLDINQFGNLVVRLKSNGEERAISFGEISVKKR